MTKDEKQNEIIEGYIIDITEKRAHEQVIELLQAYQSSVNEGSTVSITDLKGKIIYVNDKFCEVSKYSKRELIGNTHHIINSGYHDKHFYSDLWRTIRSGKPWRGEIKNKAKDGTYYWVDTVITPVFNSQQQIHQYLSVRNVITKQKEQEEELRINEERFRDIVQNTSDLIQSVADDGTLLFVNDTWLFKLGYTKEYVLGKNIFSFIHPKSKKTCELILKGLKNQETFQTTEISFITKEGKEVICEGNISALYKNNKMLHTTSMLRDITEIKRNRYELEEKRNLLLNAEKIAKVGSWYLDFKSNKAFWSKGLYNIFGIKEGTEMSFEKFISHVHDDDKDFVSETWFNTLKGEKHYIEFRIKSKLPEKWVRSIIKMEFDDLKNPRTAIGFIQDITESKNNLKKLELQQQQLKNAQKIANMGSWILDVVNDKLEWSHETYHIFELPSHIPMNLTKFLNMVHPDDRQFVADSWNAALTGKKYDIEHRIVVNGQEKWVREKAKVEFDINYRPITGIGIVHDITERKINELRLIESEMQLNDAQKIGKIGSYVWNTETDEITGSRELYEILEVKDKEKPLSFIEYFDLVSLIDKAELIKKIEIAKEQHSSFTHQFQYIALSGKVKYLEFRKTADSRHQNPALFIGTLQDITDIKMLEKNLFNSIIETEEKERERISIELHDGVCQQLSGTAMLLKMGIKSLEANDEKGINLIKDSIEILQESVSAVRNVSHQLTPQSFKDERLVDALNNLIKDFSRIDKSVQYTFHSTGKVKEPEKHIAINIYRVVQEFINNSQKHSEAKNINLNLFFEEATFLLEIKDDGKGFNISSPNTGSGIGIKNMIKRIESIGGEHEFDAAVSKGVILTIRIPYSI